MPKRRGLRQETVGHLMHCAIGQWNDQTHASELPVARIHHAAHQALHALNPVQVALSPSLQGAAPAQRPRASIGQTHHDQRGWPSHTGQARLHRASGRSRAQIHSVPHPMVVLDQHGKHECAHPWLDNRRSVPAPRQLDARRLHPVRSGSRRSASHQ